MLGAVGGRHIYNLQIGGNKKKSVQTRSSLYTKMSSKNQIREVAPRTASKYSVDKALELLRSKTRKSTKRKIQNDEEKQNIIDSYCVTSLVENYKRKIFASSGFSHSYAVLEMRNALLNSDWPAMQELFSFLLKCYHGEPLVWRYIFLILLCSPASDQYQFQEFIEMCMGNKSIEDGGLLEKLMSLKNTILK